MLPAVRGATKDAVRHDPNHAPAASGSERDRLGYELIVTQRGNSLRNNTEPNLSMAICMLNCWAYAFLCCPCPEKMADKMAEITSSKKVRSALSSAAQVLRMCRTRCCTSTLDVLSSACKHNMKADSYAPILSLVTTFNRTSFHSALLSCSLDLRARGINICMPLLLKVDCSICGS